MKAYCVSPDRDYQRSKYTDMQLMKLCRFWSNLFIDGQVRSSSYAGAALISIVEPRRSQQVEQPTCVDFRLLSVNWTSTFLADLNRPGRRVCCCLDKRSDNRSRQLHGQCWITRTNSGAPPPPICCQQSNAVFLMLSPLSQRRGHHSKV